MTKYEKAMLVIAILDLVINGTRSLQVILVREK